MRKDRPKAVGYVRASTVDRIVGRVRAMEAYCEARGWDLVRIHVDRSPGGRPAPAEPEPDVRYVVVGRKEELPEFLEPPERKEVVLVPIEDSLAGRPLVLWGTISGPLGGCCDCCSVRRP
jgi:hypothetical protein